MGLFSWLFHRNTQEDIFTEEELTLGEVPALSAEEYVLDNHVSRSKFIEDCLEQMSEASTQIDDLNIEYQDVTDYLSDMEIIEELPSKMANELLVQAKKLKLYRDEDQKYRSIPEQMSDEEFLMMERFVRELPEAIDKVYECEDYQRKVKSDLKKIDNERSAYHFRYTELSVSQNNMRGVSTIVMGAMLFSVILLFVLQFALKLDTVIGYFIVAVAGVVSLIVIFLRYEENEEELKKIEKTANRLVRLQNKVKIRYVNNTNLMDYYYNKYEIRNAKELENKWNIYLKESEARRKHANRSQDMEACEDALRKILRKSGVKSPERWMKQVDALVDSYEMKEIRHSLIIRRTKLRSQLEYNHTLVDNAQNEIDKVVKMYPQYAEDILVQVNRFQSKKRI